MLRTGSSAGRFDSAHKPPEVPALNASRYSIGFLAVLALVALRAGIGWHFFQQGLNKYENANYSSENFLRQAKGPLAGVYGSMIPDFHGFDKAMDELLGDNQAEIKDVRKVLADKQNPLDQWADQVKQDWGKYAAEAASYYQYTNERKNKDEDAKLALDPLQRAYSEEELASLRLDQALAKLDDAVDEFRGWLTDNPHEVAYLHKLQRSQTGNELPFEKPRLATQQAEVLAPQAKLKAEVLAAEKELAADLHTLLPTEKRAKHAPLAGEPSTLAKFDKFLTYSLIAIGVCLMAGLLTRLAAAGGAIFLFSLLGTQPPWIVDALPMYEQAIEMLGLIVIATTASGRWLGLDYFLYGLCRCCCGAKGKCDAS